jgi:hypothetical protein
MSEHLLPPEQRAIRRVLERAEGAIARAFLRAVRAALAAASGLTIAEILGTFGQTDPGRLVLACEVPRLVSAFEVELGPIAERLIRRAGLTGIPIFNETVAVEPLAIEVFQAKAAYAARVLVGREITLITAVQQDAILAVAETGFAAGRSPLAIAYDLEGIIGLDRRRALAQIRFAVDLASGEPSAEALRYAYGLRKRSVTWEAFRARYGKGVPLAKRATWERQAYEKRLRSRALAIARTETAAAAGRTQNLIWEEAVANGSLPQGTYVRQLIRIPAAKPCPVCGPADRKFAPIGGRFPGGYAGTPLHTCCLCGERLFRLDEVPEDQRAALAGSVLF